MLTIDKRSKVVLKCIRTGLKVINMEKKKKSRFFKKYKEKMDLNKLKFHLREIRKLTQVEVEIADLWEIAMWTQLK